MVEHKGNTNQTNTVKLESSIDRVVWERGIAATGANVGLAVDTHFVGNNSEMEIKLEDSDGKSFGKFKDKISANKFWCTLQIPEDCGRILYATVKLPKHGLEMKSNPLLVIPIKIKNAKWDKEEARRGDVLKLTAYVEKAEDGMEGEIQIYEHDADGAHDLITKIPVVVKSQKVETEWAFEYHEDTDDIVRNEESELGYNPPEYFFRVDILGVTADSGLLRFKDWLRIELLDYAGNPIPNAEYVLHMPDGSDKEGTLDDEGKAIEENLPPGRIDVEFRNVQNSQSTNRQ
ncbi:MAG: hypothetical protein V1720_17710 [bacterium]